MAKAAGLNFKSKLEFYESFPLRKEFQNNHVLIYDQILEKFSELTPFINQFPVRMSVRGGETLKDLSALAQYIRRVMDLTDKMNTKELKLVALGGGSVGDFVGFLASIYKRGVGFVQIPSTWLAAIDSSHGGKNALNVGSVKNQIGTFYPAEKVYIIEPLLRLQPKERALEGFAELFKMFLLQSKKGEWKKLVPKAKEDLTQVIWRNLKWGIQQKYKVVLKDPMEKTGYRQILNFGHTFGHVIEANLRLPHGISVLYGMQFALKWSRHRKYLKETELNQILECIDKAGFKPARCNLREFEVRDLLRKDKKSSGVEMVNFIFLKKPGLSVVEKMKVDEIVQEAKRQNYIL